jgi:probable phosphoglycerate mutase
MTPLCVIVRHGNTFEPGEPARRIGARTDLPLVSSGREQALRLGRLFAERGWRFDRVLTSPLRRTRESAGLILSATGQDAPIEACAWLAEIDHGPDEDRPETDVIARIGAAALAAWDTQGAAPPGWQVDAEARRQAWLDFFASKPARITLLVTSNGAARFALLAEHALTQRAATLSSLKLATGAFGTVTLGADGPCLVEWNVRP